MAEQRGSEPRTPCLQSRGLGVTGPAPSVIANQDDQSTIRRRSLQATQWLLGMLDDTQELVESKLGSKAGGVSFASLPALVAGGWEMSGEVGIDGVRLVNIGLG